MGNIGVKKGLFRGGVVRGASSYFATCENFFDN